VGAISRALDGESLDRRGADAVWMGVGVERLRVWREVERAGNSSGRLLLLFGVGGCDDDDEEEDKSVSVSVWAFWDRLH